MAVRKLSYEETRRKRMEENKKRMEALKLPQLSQALRKPSTIKQTKSYSLPKQTVAMRRSRRVAKKPPPYKQAEKPTRNLSNHAYASEEVRMEALEKAEKLVSDLESWCPTFLKSMVVSYVNGTCGPAIPSQFCRDNLPKHDEIITLIDEDGDEFSNVYSARNANLRIGGWKGFAVAHNLAYGDALVFQLIRPTTFKVYIIRGKIPTATKGNNVGQHVKI